MTQQELKHILSSKFDFEKWKDLLGTMFLKIDYLTKPIQIEAALVKSGGQVGVIRLDDGRSLGLFKFEVADNIKIARNRKGLRDIAIKYVDQDITHGALVFYYSEDQADYRLTFVSKQTSLNEDGEFVTKATAPKRYTFLLGENEPCTTAANRLLELINKKKSGSVYLADVTEAFSVERLNKDFFKGYKDQYGKFLNYIGEQSKANRDYVKKLLGRLVFLQFLQKKGWMGVPANRNDWEGGDKNYLYNLVKKYNGNNRLLSDVLEVLFFNTLNEKRTNDIANPILGDNIKIPYLNGGLFDKDDLDKKDIDFPYPYFEELMEFFGMYNFTIDENDPDDAEVGVDPEMLGHIFENLLEDNKDKGAFYTPKEIVQYMSQESIAQYLKTHTEEALHSAIDELIKERKVNDVLQNKASASKVYDLLRNVKVCDPAIGSGAFPMGVLNVLYHSRLLLYGFTKPTQGFSPSAIKREIIQNNIYGVDIEKGAIDIARLRFWLSIVVDSDMPEALPNFDYKFMQGNSLLESFDGLDMSRIAGRTVGRPSNSPQLIIGLDSDLNRKNLQKLMRQYFSTDNHAAKTELRQTINNEVKSLIRNSIGGTTTTLNHLEQLDCSANSDFFLWHTWFKDVFDNGGFDVVIGNPPYFNIQSLGAHSPYAETIKKTFSDIWQDKSDILFYFFRVSLNLSNNVICFITSNAYLFSDKAKKLRNKMLEDGRLSKIINFEEFMVFNSASITTAITLFSNNKKSFETVNVRGKGFSLETAVEFIQDSRNAYEVNLQKNSVFALVKSSISNLNERIDGNHKKLNELFKAGKGMETAANNVFCFSEYPAQFPRKFIKRRMCGEIINKYIHSEIDEYILYFEDVENFEDLPKSIQEYLLDNKNLLDKRATVKNEGRIWWRYSRPMHKEYYHFNKIWCSYRSKTNMFAIDESSDYIGLTNTTVIFDTNKGLSLKYLLALLNSKILTFRYKSIGKQTGNGIYEYFENGVGRLPIPQATKEQQKPIVALVDQILTTKKKNLQADTSVWERKIDLLVYHLYGLNYEEILIVDPETSITKVEYESMII